jgi:hypothetical protein
LEENKRREYIETLKETPTQLKEAVAGVRKKILIWHPAPGKWSIQQIVCHMRDMEQGAYLARYTRILEEDNPTLPDLDGDVLALERGYQSLKLGEVLRDWKRARRESLRLLRKVKGAQWQRVGTHEVDGPLTLEQLLQRHAVGNDLAHLGQIRGIKTRWEILSRLERGPAELAKLTRGIQEDVLRRRPAPDEWSMIETACHMRDVEQFYAERFTKIVHQDRPRFWVMDNERVADQRRYREANLKSVLKEFRQLRADTLTLLKAVPHPVWQRTGIHPEHGEMSIEQLAKRLGSHDERHLEEIRALRK